MAIEVTEDMELVLYRFTKKSWVRHTFSYINLSNLFSRIVKNKGQIQDAKYRNVLIQKKYVNKNYYWQFCDSAFVKKIAEEFLFTAYPSEGKKFFFVKLKRNIF